MTFYKRLPALLVVIVTAFFCCVTASAQNSAFSELLSVSFRGDTANYPANSLEAVASAKKIGADMVSVGVRKTADGVFVLCDSEDPSSFLTAPFESVKESSCSQLEEGFLTDKTGKATEYKIARLEDVLAETKDIVLILDFQWEDRDGLYAFIEDEGALDRVILRTYESAKEIVSWTQTKEKAPCVLGIYDGNIIFNAISHFNLLTKAGMPLIQYQSKNYFNVMYGEAVYKRFLEKDSVGIVAPMYSAELCGQRYDSAASWSEMIDKGFNVIETNNISSLVSYIEEAEELKVQLSELTVKAKAIQTDAYSDLSANRLQQAVAQGEELVMNTSSADKLQQGCSQLIYAMNNLNFKDGTESQKGELKITAGKIIAASVVGLFILAAQIYAHKMQGEKSRKKES